MTVKVFPEFNHGIFFPLLKWSKLFHSHNIDFMYLNNHLSKELFECDMIIVDWRYIDLQVKGWYRLKGVNATDATFLNETLAQAKLRGINRVLFDSTDSAGIRTFDILPYIDICLKKQVFKDLERYTRIEGEHKAMIWLPDSVPELATYRSRVMSLDDLKKIRVGWNIGLTDFRYFPDFVNKIRIGTTNILPRTYHKLKVESPYSSRSLLFSYRGSLRSNPRYDYSRKIMIETLESRINELHGDFVLGGKVAKNSYLRELRSSMIGLSPFGWGEICFRDFEIMLNGSLLVKPSVEHLSTWPDFFKPDVTYLPVKWDYSDLIDTLNEIKKNWKAYIEVSNNAQLCFIDSYHDGTSFVNHFKKQVELN